MLLTRLKPGGAAVFVLLAAIGPLSIELSLPWLPRMGVALATDAAGLQLTLSAWLLGFAVAQALSRQLSSSYGPRTMVVGGLALYALATVACMVGPASDLFTFARLVQGFGGGAALAAAASFPGGGQRSPRATAGLAAALGLVAMVAPVASGMLASMMDWRFGYAMMLVLAGVALLLVRPVVPERRALPDEGLWRDFWRSDGFVALVIGACLSAAGLFAFASASPFVLQEGYALSPAAYGASFALAVFGFVAGAVLGGAMAGRLGIGGVLRIGAAAQAIGGLGVLGGILFGPGSVAEIIGPMGIYLFGAGLVLPQAAAGVAQIFPQRAREAMSVLMICQASVAALVGAMVGYTLGTSALPLGMGVASMGVLSAIVQSATRETTARDARDEDEVVPDFSGV